MTRIGFIGLGNMGAPMALNLKKAGHDVRVFDAMPDAVSAGAANGLTTCTSAQEAATQQDVVILMLPNGTIVSDVSTQIVPVMQAGSLLIDCSTIDVSSAKSLHKLADTNAINCLDAPVSGGVGGAAAGTLTFMVGGSEQAFSTGKSLFDIMGQKSVHCGDGSSGQAAKICNNMLLGISMIGACEAFALAEKLGLSQTALFDVVSTSSGSCWSVNTYCPVPDVGPRSPADNDYKPGFAAGLMLKDLGLSQQAADDVDASTPLGQHATKLYQHMIDAGFARTDFSGMINFLKSQTNKG